ncbi:oxalate:formate antiporter [Moniliophthora roreri MCA 2997]|uniref:Lysosomal dipeptide transporter MFSD1 n=1 Tax=Moniliophthora roreri (strain MCA 2997) TaxID=1381753 RepID=V2X8U5_MONRO|nr:oxalate:formate antiporter [Moniliophthora roreri MCA 2997]
MAGPSDSDTPRHDHRRESCDNLLAEPYDSEHDEEPLDRQGLLGRRSSEDHAEELEAEVVLRRRRSLGTSPRSRAVFIRTLALLCACCLSIGSHYASYILGPLKSRLSRELEASHTEFSLLFSAFSLNSTWTPLVGGIMASTLGTTFTSIFATGIVLTGQLLLLLGEVWGNIRLMTFGLFIFGLGVSPLAVVQETIIVRFFKSHGLGVSMAFGLLAGKGASFVSARTSYPLTERFGSHAPFYVATILAGMSFFVNLAYIAASKWLVDGAQAELEAADISEEARRRSVINMSESQALEKVAAKKRVNLREITKLGDVFWAYVALNVFCGMIWAPFTHLASNIIETRYGMNEENAANTASFLLAGSIFLYPLCGFLVDRYKHRPIVIQLLLLSSTLTGLAYVWLAVPTQWTGSPIPAILSFMLGYGFAPLLLVVLVPKIVSLKYVSTALGVHKSLEQTGTVIFQTLAGLTLDQHKNNTGRNSKSAAQRLLSIWVILNVVQLMSILALAYLQRKKDEANQVLGRSPSPASRSPSRRRRETTSDHSPLLGSEHNRYSSTTSGVRRSLRDEAQVKREIRRGEVFASLSASLVIFAWVLFMGTAYFRLGMKKHN